MKLVFEDKKRMNEGFDRGIRFEIEPYIDEDTDKKMVFICADDGASGAEYRCKNIEDIGKALVRYLSNYYPELDED